MFLLPQGRPAAPAHAPHSYSTADVARRLGVSLQTVQRWVDAGHLQAWKTPGGHRRIDAAAAQALFRQQHGRIGAAAAPAGASAGVAVGAAAAPVTVAVVDDDPLDLALLVTLVQRAVPDAAIETAGNGFQGLVVIGKTAPQIVVTDIQMPHMDGFEMIRALLHDPAARPGTVIAVSALSGPELARRGTLPPEVQVFTKPIDPDRFTAALRRASVPRPAPD